MNVISFDSQVCRDLNQSLKREWIETNQFGGYASSTIALINTRRYHGLFVPQLKPPLGRHVLLSHVEEILYIDDVAYPLSSQLYSESTYPEGYKNINEFTLLPFPTWTYYIEDLVLTKSIIFMHDEQTVIVRYQLLEGDRNFVRLEVKPLTPFRSIHSLTHMNDRFNTIIDVSAGRISFAGLFFYHNAAIIDQSGKWYQHIYYAEEKERGLDFQEDAYHPFRLVYTFLNEADPYLCASLQDREIIHPSVLISHEENRRYRILKDIQVTDSRFQLLAYSCHKFFIDPFKVYDHTDLISNSNPRVTAVESAKNGHKNDQTKKIITAGYPWFENSARDALIAFHGLTLSTGQYQIARNVLSFYADQVQDGLLPIQKFSQDENNLYFHSNQEKDYGEADTPLWLIHAAYEYYQYSHDHETLSYLFPILSSIVEHYIKGTQFNIHMSQDGLIEAAHRGKALTWMNAVTDANIPITAREGKPVEIQALWYNALCALAELSEGFGKLSLKRFYDQMALSARRSFNRVFWNPSLGYLYDVVGEKKNDGSLRPNQLFALSLPFPILEENPSKWRSILDITKQNLLTPFGLRSLSLTDPYYQKTCYGDRAKRSRAYHQGSVWPWLLVPYLSASIKVSSDPKQEKIYFLEFLTNFLTHVEKRGLGFISEIFDGEAPYEAREATAHAVNVAAFLELYELLIEDKKLFQRKIFPIAKLT